MASLNWIGSDCIGSVAVQTERYSGKSSRLAVDWIRSNWIGSVDIRRKTRRNKYFSWIRSDPSIYLFIYFFPIPSIVFVLLLQLPPFRKSDQPLGHITGAPPPSSLRCVPSNLVARRVQQFLPSSTRDDLCVHTLVARKKPHSVGLDLAKSALVVMKLNHYTTGGSFGRVGCLLFRLITRVNTKDNTLTIPFPPKSRYVVY